MDRHPYSLGTVAWRIFDRKVPAESGVSKHEVAMNAEEIVEMVSDPKASQPGIIHLCFNRAEWTIEIDIIGMKILAYTVNFGLALAAKCLGHIWDLCPGRQERRNPY